MAVDLGDGQPVAIGQLDEANPLALRRFLEPLVQPLGVRVIITDDLTTYRTAVAKLELEHQVYQFNVRRWVGKALHELRQSLPQEWTNNGTIPYNALMKALTKSSRFIPALQVILHMNDSMTKGEASKVLTYFLLPK